MSPELLNLIVVLVMLTALIGLLIPVFPGVEIMWLTSIVYGIVAGMDTAGWIMLAIITALTLVGFFIDNLIMGAAARQGGASWTSIILAFIAGIAGTFLIPPIGGVIAAPAVLYLYEWRRLGDRHKAWQAMRGLAIGWGTAFLARFGIGILVIIAWGAWAYVV